MNRIAYSQVLELATQLLTGDSEADRSLAASFNTFLNARLRRTWRSFAWPELCPIEMRFFRNAWDSATAYAASTPTVPVEVYFGDAGRYYQALRSNTNQPPATLVGGDWVANADYWADSSAGYSGDSWTASTAYTKGQTVFRPSNARYYACHTGHTSGATFDETKFGILTPFIKYIAPNQAGQNAIGDVLEAYVEDPRLANTGFRLSSTPIAEGWLIKGATNAWVWIKYRKPVPVFSGAVYNPTLSYAKGLTVFYGTDYYTAGANVSVGVTPPNSPWEIIEFPAVLWMPTALGAYADQLASDGQEDKSAVQQRLAKSALDEEIESVAIHQGGSSTMNVRYR